VYGRKRLFDWETKGEKGTRAERGGAGDERLVEKSIYVKYQM
jgi:hypothetical protein